VSFSDLELLNDFVNCFVKLDDSRYYADNPPPEQLSLGVNPDDWTEVRWAPASMATPAEFLSDLPFWEGLPDLYQQLVLSFRWLEVDLKIATLLENPPSCDLKPLAKRMNSDPVLQNTLSRNRLVPFARASCCYDPICFDLNRPSGKDCPIVRLNHESILMNDQVGEITAVADSFRDFVLAVIESAR